MYYTPTQDLKLLAVNPCDASHFYYAALLLNFISETHKKISEFLVMYQFGHAIHILSSNYRISDHVAQETIVRSGCVKWDRNQFLDLKHCSLRRKPRSKYDIQKDTYVHMSYTKSLFPKSNCNDFQISNLNAMLFEVR